MKPAIWILCATGLVWPALADDLRVNQLENTVQRLQRELDAQTRRIDQLERAARTTDLSGLAQRPVPRFEASPAWLIAANWDKVRPGMSERDVTAILGEPTSARADPGGTSRTLFYALELGPTALLAGNVRLGDSGVTEVTTPTLR